MNSVSCLALDFGFSLALDFGSGLALNFGYGLALDFGLDPMQLVNFWGSYSLYVNRAGAHILLGPVLCTLPLFYIQIYRKTAKAFNIDVST